MKLADVGSVPVIDDHETKHLLGIVTDRDIVVKSVAPNAETTAFVSEIMTRDPETCGPDDEVEKAMKIMAEHQVRRIPVVDGEGRLLGIIAQGDIAASAKEKKTGEVVKEISKPA